MFSVLCFENLGQRFVEDLKKQHISQLHSSLYDLYRRARNHHWDKALSLSIRALIHKRRTIYSADDDYSTHRIEAVDQLVAVLDSTGSLSATPEEKQSIFELVTEIRKLSKSEDIRQAAEKVGAAFAELDFVSPTIFNIQKARKLTDRLYQPRGHLLTGIWSMVEHENIKTLLSKNPKLVKSFGPIDSMLVDDLIWRWWAFVIFDGTQWRSFHLDEDFRISSEPFLDANDRASRPANFTQILCEEFAKAAKL